MKCWLKMRTVEIPQFFDLKPRYIVAFTLTHLHQISRGYFPARVHLLAVRQELFSITPRIPSMIPITRSRFCKPLETNFSLSRRRDTNSRQIDCQLARPVPRYELNSKIRRSLSGNRDLQKDSGRIHPKAESMLRVHCKSDSSYSRGHTSSTIIILSSNGNLVNSKEVPLLLVLLTRSIAFWISGMINGLRRKLVASNERPHDILLRQYFRAARMNPCNLV